MVREMVLVGGQGRAVGDRAENGVRDGDLVCSEDGQGVEKIIESLVRLCPPVGQQEPAAGGGRQEARGVLGPGVRSAGACSATVARETFTSRPRWPTGSSGARP
jgi:hypothetical protein